MRLALAVTSFVLFTSWSLWVAATHGPLGFLPLASKEPWAAQMLVDLVISLALAMGWLVPDAKRSDISPWPYVALTLLVGSISPLAYLVHRETVRRVTRGVSRQAAASPQ
jgi:hypothetical protein